MNTESETTDKTEKLLAERTKLIEQNKRNETRIWNINLELAANKTSGWDDGNKGRYAECSDCGASTQMVKATGRNINDIDDLAAGAWNDRALAFDGNRSSLEVVLEMAEAWFNEYQSSRSDDENLDNACAIRNTKEILRLI